MRKRRYIFSEEDLTKYAHAPYNFTHRVLTFFAIPKNIQDFHRCVSLADTFMWA